MKQTIYGNIRTQFFGTNTVRIEYGENGRFYDQNTLFIPDKTQREDVSIAYTMEDGVFWIVQMYLPVDAKSLLGVRLERAKIIKQ